MSLESAKPASRPLWCACRGDHPFHFVIRPCAPAAESFDVPAGVRVMIVDGIHVFVKERHIFETEETAKEFELFARNNLRAYVECVTRRNLIDSANE